MIDFYAVDGYAFLNQEENDFEGHFEAFSRLLKRYERENLLIRFFKFNEEPEKKLERIIKQGHDRKRWARFEGEGKEQLMELGYGPLDVIFAYPYAPNNNHKGYKFNFNDWFDINPKYLETFGALIIDKNLSKYEGPLVNQWHTFGQKDEKLRRDGVLCVAVFEFSETNKSVNAVHCATRTNPIQAFREKGLLL